MPNNSYDAPPAFYVDKPFKCIDCGTEEVWTAKQQKWYYEQEKGTLYATAVRCRACRRKNRDQKARQREQMEPKNHPASDTAIPNHQVPAMKAIEIRRNGETLGTAGLEDGIVTVKLTLRNQVDPVWFDVDGRNHSTGGHERWAHLSVAVGDEFTMKLVEVDATNADAGLR